ncbi:MG2 domain-containing protein [Olivibacter sp. XZL3]|uniref:MG2 domain-containing protein n=1 Tax=Olivibacter sp. XZL3 TaxID=1735116 RepID=UPI001064D081|nr:MG2 domain-containing protein [Olivibacter sp. XZL3]
MKRFSFLLLVLISFAGYAQKRDTTDALQRTLKNLETFQQKHPQERVYLQTDRSYYEAGDDIWFKAYVTVSQFNLLSAISKIMYVELLNDQQEVVQSRRLPVISGLSMGDFKLPETLVEGRYHIRAYTNWMRNFDEGLFFHKPITVNSRDASGIITRSSFIYRNTEEKDKQVHGTVLLTDFDGRPIPNKQVAFELKGNGKTIAQQEVATDEIGRLRFQFPYEGRKRGQPDLLILHIDQGSEGPTVKTVPVVVRPDKRAVHLYPEGGTMLPGIQNRIGFQVTRNAIEEQGEVQGLLKSGQQVIARFNSDSTGLGSFSFVPEAHKEYTVLMHFGDGDTLRMPLADVREEGFHLAVNNLMDQGIVAQLSATEKQLKNQQIACIVQSQGMVFYAAKQLLNKPEIVFNIPKKDLPSGILELAMLDEQMDLIASRKVFILNPRDTLGLRVTPDQTSYAPRERVTLNIEGLMPDTADVGALSASVINISKIPKVLSVDNDILSTLLLQSNTYDTFDQPVITADYEDKRVQQRIDELMLTQPSNRVFWKNIKEGKFPEIAYKPEKELRISGIVTNQQDEPVANAKVTIASFKPTATVLDTVTDSAGRFNFDKLLFYDQTDFLVQARDARGKKNVKVKLDEVPSQAISQAENKAGEVRVSAKEGPDSQNSEKSLDEIQQYGFSGKSIVLEEVEVKAKKENPAKHSANLNGPGNADQVISGDELYFNGCPTLDICLQGRLVGVRFMNGIPYSTRSMNRPMQIIVDGMYMDPSALNIINPFDIASVEVLRTVGNTAIYGMYGSNGVLIITTRRGDQPRRFGPELYTPGVTTFSPQGFYEIRNFPSPDYGATAEKVNEADRRTTIYWQPDVIIQQDQPASVSFYSADEPGVYRIEVEGLDVNGRLAKTTSYITVKNQ